MSQEFELSIKAADYEALVAVLHEALKRGLAPTLKPVETVAVQGSFRSSAPVRPAARVDVDLSAGARWNRLLGFCSPGQLEVLKAIKELRRPTTATGLSGLLGITTNQFTGRLNGGLQKNIKKAGFNVEDVILIGENESSVTYYPGKVLDNHEVPPPGGAK